MIRFFFFMARCIGLAILVKLRKLWYRLGAVIFHQNVPVPRAPAARMLQLVDNLDSLRTGSMACDSMNDVFDGLKVFVEGKDIKIGEHLGEGSQGYVRKARIIPSRKRVAVKQYDISEYYEDHITSEIRNLKAARGHIGIVKLLGVYVKSVNSRAQKGIVLEYCGGGSLDKAFESSEIDYNVSNIIDWIKQITEAVKHIHDHGIIHRDLKPANILFTSTDLKTLKICDFSDCTTLPKESAVVEHTSKRGTSGYRATEIEDSCNYTNKADVFSLGRTILCILFRLNPERTGMPFYKFYCSFVIHGINLFMKTPAMLDIFEDEDMKKKVYLFFQLYCDLTTLAATMYSTDVAERPTLDAACVRLQEIMDEYEPVTKVIYDLDFDFLMPRILCGMNHFVEIIKQQLSAESRFALTVSLEYVANIFLRLPYCDEAFRSMIQMTLCVRREDDIDQMSQIYHHHKFTWDQVNPALMQLCSAINMTTLEHSIYDFLLAIM